jgi:hypothetical protein
MPGMADKSGSRRNPNSVTGYDDADLVHRPWSHMTLPVDVAKNSKEGASAPSFSCGFRHHVANSATPRLKLAGTEPSSPQTGLNRVTGR